MKLPLSLQDHAWLVTVPKRAEFSEPLFHFGERVKFRHGHGSTRFWETGRVLGLKFDELEQWVYSILLDSESPVVAFGVQEVTAKQSELQLVKDSCYIRDRIQAQQEWFLTKEAASKLGLTATQLRKLRLNGVFKSGHHYRDISVPTSGLPRWQWHAERCSKALEASGKRRCTH